MAVFNFHYGLADGERMGSLYNWKMRQKRVLMWRNSDSVDRDITLYSCIFVALYKTTWGSVWNCWGKGEELWLSGPRQCLVHRRRRKMMTVFRQWLHHWQTLGTNRNKRKLWDWMVIWWENGNPIIISLFALPPICEIVWRQAWVIMTIKAMPDKV